MNVNVYVSYGPASSFSSLSRYNMFTWTTVFIMFLSHCGFIQICRIENVSHLSELRVLNLAGNNITRLENLQGLDCLTELNLRHNCISVVVSILFHTGDIFNNIILIHNIKAKTAQPAK